MPKRDGEDQARYVLAMLIPGHPRIDANPDICGGRPRIAGTRLRVVDVLEMIAGGTSEEEIVADFPFVTVEDVRACVALVVEYANHPVIVAAAAE